jgi:hypothetical protein
LDRELPPQLVAMQSQLLAILGLLPERYPLREKLLDLYQEQAAGFYLPPRGQLVVVEEAVEKIRALTGGSMDAFAMVLSHELDHALTDQHFDLQRLLEDPALRSRDDAKLARQAVGEGDATLLMMLFMFHRMGLTPTPETMPSTEAMRTLMQGLGPAVMPEFNQAPPYVKVQLMEPYLLGLELVLNTWKAGGWKAVDALWKKPPASTEQLMHPDRRGDPPADVRLNNVPEGWNVAGAMELGELGLRTLLAEKVGADEAAIAAAGWGGDREALLERTRPTARADSPPLREMAALVVTTWDAPKDADEFSSAAEKWLRATAKPGDESRIDRRGLEVRVFLRPATHTEDAVAPAVKAPSAPAPAAPGKGE